MLKRPILCIPRLLPPPRLHNALCRILSPSCKSPHSRRHFSTAEVKHTPLRPFLIERYDGWFDGSESLSSSECESISMRELLSHADPEALDRWENLSLAYPDPSEGDYRLREAIASRHYYDSVNPRSHINVCAPQEGIFLALSSLLQPGDHVVVTTPCYQSLTEVARSLGCTVSGWRPEGLEAGATPRFEPATLERLLQPNTKLVVANWPHNPTGALPTAGEFERVLDACDARGCHLFVDEMYRHLEHAGDGARLPPACVAYDRGVSLSGLSKTHGLPGLRIGWVCARDEALMRRVAQLKDYTTIVPAAPSQALAIVALTTGFEPLLARSRAIVARELEALRSFVRAHADVGLEWCEPSAGTFAFVRLKGLGPGGASAYADALRARKRLMLIPSALFEEAADDRVRLTYGLEGTAAKLERWGEDLRMYGTSGS